MVIMQDSISWFRLQTGPFEKVSPILGTVRKANSHVYFIYTDVGWAVL